MSFCSVGHKMEIYLINYRNLFFIFVGQSKHSYYLCYLEEVSIYNISSGFRFEHNVGNVGYQFRLVAQFDPVWYTA